MKPKHIARGVAVAVACCALSLAVAAPVPAPSAKGGDKWEYCEVHLRTTSTRGGLGGQGGPGGGGGGPGAGGAPGAGRVSRTTARLVTADEEVEAEGWEDLAKKLKAPAAKKGATAAVHKMRVLNHLGAQGWELVPANGGELSSSATLLFKRKVAK